MIGQHIKREEIAVLVDPEKSNDSRILDALIAKCAFAGIHYFFVGGSTVNREDLNFVVRYIKKNSAIPVVLFPGSSQQLSEAADAILYLSLISGRNPDFLIGHHVMSANELFSMDIEVIPTGYILVDGGTNSSVAYVSQTTPIPSDQTSIILNTAKAGILLGKKLLYLDAGSGAQNHVPVDVVRSVAFLGTPLIVGGGIRSIDQIKKIQKAGASIVVIGNKIEDDIDFLLDIKSHINQEQAS